MAELPPVLTKEEEQEDIIQEELENSSLEQRKFQSIMKELGKKIEGAGDSFKEGVKSATHGMKESGRTLGEDLTTGLMGPLRLVMEPMGITGKSVFEGLGKGISRLRESFHKSSEGIQGLPQELGDEVLKEQEQEPEEMTSFENNVLGSITELDSNLQLKLEDLDQSIRESLPALSDGLTADAMIPERGMSPISAFDSPDVIFSNPQGEDILENEDAKTPILPFLNMGKEETPERFFPRRNLLLRKGGVEGAAAVYMVDSLLKEDGGEDREEGGGILDSMMTGGFAALGAALGPLIMGILPTLLPILLAAGLIAALVALVPWQQIMDNWNEKADEWNTAAEERRRPALLADALSQQTEDEEWDKLLEIFAEQNDLLLETGQQRRQAIRAMEDDVEFLEQQLANLGVDISAEDFEQNVQDVRWGITDVQREYASETAAGISSQYETDEETGRITRAEQPIREVVTLEEQGIRRSISLVLESGLDLNPTLQAYVRDNPDVYQDDAEIWDKYGTDSVEDAIITNDGQIIHTDPDDQIIATKNPISYSPVSDEMPMPSPQLEQESALTQADHDAFMGESFGEQIHAALLLLTEVMQKKEFNNVLTNIGQANQFDPNQFRFSTVS